MMIIVNELGAKYDSPKPEFVNIHPHADVAYKPNCWGSPVTQLTHDKRLSFASHDTCEMLGQQTPGS